MKIYITGYASYEDWQRAGYPGAPSFAHPKTKVTREPDRRRGLCTYPECDNVIAAYGSLTLELCQKHYALVRNDNAPIFQRKYVPLAER